MVVPKTLPKRAHICFGIHLSLSTNFSKAHQCFYWSVSWSSFSPLILNWISPKRLKILFFPLIHVYTCHLILGGLFPALPAATDGIALIYFWVWVVKQLKTLAPITWITLKVPEMKFYCFLYYLLVQKSLFYLHICMPNFIKCLNCLKCVASKSF